MHHPIEHDDLETDLAKAAELLRGADRVAVLTGAGISAESGLATFRGAGELLRPDVVWFYEALPADVWAETERAASACECFLVVGTSAIVYPAAELVPLARFNKARVIEINLTRTPASQYADVTLCGPSGQVLPELVKRLEGR